MNLLDRIKETAEKIQLRVSELFFENEAVQKGREVIDRGMELVPDQPPKPNTEFGFKGSLDKIGKSLGKPKGVMAIVLRIAAILGTGLLGIFVVKTLLAVAPALFGAIVLAFAVALGVKLTTSMVEYAILGAKA